MRAGRAPFFAAIVLALYCATASAKEAGPDQTASPQDSNRPKPVTTTIIKQCPDGYELVIRTGGRRGCAKDIVPPND